MAGHSKWANIQHRKNAQDAKRGKIFTKLIREITVSARMGGPDAASNSRLRTVLDKAYAANMSRDTVERAIKRGSGEGADAHALQEVRYEGYGPNGVAIMVDCLTDNRNRTVGEVRHVLTKHGGNLGTEGSVSYLFEKKAQFIFEPGTPEAKILEAAIENGADDVVTLEDGAIEVLAPPELFAELKAAFQVAGFEAAHAESAYLPRMAVPLEGEPLDTIFKMVDLLEDLDDVQSVYTNVEG